MSDAREGKEAVERVRTTLKSYYGIRWKRPDTKRDIVEELVAALRSTAPTPKTIHEQIAEDAATFAAMPEAEREYADLERRAATGSTMPDAPTPECEVCDGKCRGHAAGLCRKCGEWVRGRQNNDGYWVSTSCGCYTDEAAPTPADQGVVERVNARIAEHRAHLAEIEKAHCRPFFDESAVGIVVNFGDLLALQARITALEERMTDAKEALEGKMSAPEAMVAASKAWAILHHGLNQHKGGEV